jgi:tetraacyldisaccharide-1-P 4'-kinase
LAQSAVAALATPQQTLLMTEKDAVKCRDLPGKLVVSSGRRDND